ncbi:uncharacterized protein CLUP02_06396, partial [Colletotrichum lupini]
NAICFPHPSPFNCGECIRPEPVRSRTSSTPGAHPPGKQRLSHFSHATLHRYRSNAPSVARL